jgi:hypothetical protein
MKTKGLSRIVIGVNDLEEAIERYSRLLGATFVRIPREISEQFGSLVAISWEAQLELVSSIPGIQGRGLLEKKLGLMGVIYNCDDAKAASELAADMGGAVVAKIEMDQTQIDDYLGGRFSCFLEYALDPVITDGVPSALAQIVDK